MSTVGLCLNKKAYLKLMDDIANMRKAGLHDESLRVTELLSEAADFAETSEGDKLFIWKNKEWSASRHEPTGSVLNFINFELDPSDFLYIKLTDDNNSEVLGKYTDNPFKFKLSSQIKYVGSIPSNPWYELRKVVEQFPPVENMIEKQPHATYDNNTKATIKKHWGL